MNSRVFSRSAIAALGFAFATASLTDGQAQTQDDTAFEVDVTLTPEAAQRVVALGEHIGILVFYFGHPSPGGRLQGDGMGHIGLADEDVTLPATGGRIRIAARKFERKRVPYILNRQVLIGVTTASAGRVGQNNVIDCNYYEGPLAPFDHTPLRIFCKPL